jgi:HAD superfamily hydrolase (TIGR01509 family)
METLVTEPFWHALPEFFGTSRDELLAQLHPTAWIEFEEARITEEEYFELFFEDRRPVDAAGVRACLLDAFQWLDGIEPLLRELAAAGYPMHALSNYPVWYQLIEQKLALSRYLNWSFVSCLTGLRKPDKRAYLNALSHLQIEPQECLFIDDRRVNVEAARSLGIDAVMKHDAQQLRRELSDRGLVRS